MASHWVEAVADRVERSAGEGVIVGNGGLSVSGLQHVGRLRGEVTIVDSVLRVLRRRGREVRHLLTLYTMDPWKGKEAQLRQFSDPSEAEAYRGMPLCAVPDPHGCHDSWVEHYWEDFGAYLNRFAEDVDVVTTKDLYERNERMKEFVVAAIRRRGEVIRVLNKYRGRRPYPPDWVPFEPVCDRCGKIDSTEALEADLTNYRVRYVCRACGFEGWGSMERGKLNWRLEWVGVWYALNVSFEPYGKDHATPGGSRDSCVDLAVNVFDIRPPEGLAYEWVGYQVDNRDMGDMGSSDFIGFTPREWVEVAEPEVLRFQYLSTSPMKRVLLNLSKVPAYTDEFDRAERIYYGTERARDEELGRMLAKAYELSLLGEPPESQPFQLRYVHAVALVQTLPSRGRDLDEALERLRRTGYLKGGLGPADIERIERRLRLASRWLERYAPPVYRIELLEEFRPELLRDMRVDVRRMLRELVRNLSGVEWTEAGIRDAMVRIERTREEEREFFRVLYLAFFGRPHGPRIAPYLAMLDRDWVLRRIGEVLKALGSGA